jgi:DNA ligase 4
MIMGLSSCFYVDSPENASMHGMVVKSKHVNDISQRQAQAIFEALLARLIISSSFAELSKTITQNGGRVVNLDEPKLTHVVIDKRDDSRRLELMKRTSK